MSHDLQGFKHPRWLAGFLPSTVSSTSIVQGTQGKNAVPFPWGPWVEAQEEWADFCSPATSAPTPSVPRSEA